MTVMIILYLAITLFAITMTYNEQKRSGNSSFLFEIIGYLACVVWPATLAAMLIALRFHTPEARQSLP